MVAVMTPSGGLVSVPDYLPPDPPPLFGSSLRLLDPTLAQEESSAIFMAFRRRRLQHGRSLTQRLADRQLGALLTLGILFGWGTALYPGALLFAVRELRPAVLLGVMVGIFGLAIWMIVIGLRRRVGESTRLPGFLSSVMGMAECRPDQVRDLWLAGATGREMALALYLEAWEDWRRVVAPVGLLVGGLCVRPLLALMATPTPAAAAVGLTLVLAAALGIAAVVPLGSLHAAIMTDARRSVLMKYLNYRVYLLENIVGGLAGAFSLVVFACFGVALRRFGQMIVDTVRMAADGFSPLLLHNLYTVMGVAVLALLGSVLASRLAQRLVRFSFRRMDSMLPDYVTLTEEGAGTGPR